MNGNKIYLAAFVCVFMLLDSTCLALENQIINGEFDNGIEPWQRSGGDGYTAEVVQNAGLSGTNALKVDVFDANAQESIMISQGGLFLERGAKYHIGFTAKADTDRQMGVILEQDGGWAYAWHEWIDLTSSPQTFSFEHIHDRSTTDNVTLCFIVKHSLFPLLNANENIDVYIDGVYVVQEPPVDPNLAHYPWPFDGAMHSDTWATLSWSPGRHAVSHDVYFGENYNEVYNGTGDTYWGNQHYTFFVYGFPDYAGSPGLIPGTTYYWRIDEVNDLHPDSPWRGDVWSFWLPPYTAYDPIPVDEAELIDPNVTLSWTAGFGAKLHYLYFGENLADVEAGTGGTFKGYLSETSYFPSPLEFDKTYYWRVDEFDWTTHQGEIWSFTTFSMTAGDPYPPDGDIFGSENVILRWKSGTGAVLHDVYFGTTFDDVNNADISDSSGVYRGRSAETSYTPEVLEPYRIYYWRIDELKDDGVTVHKGKVWSFMAAEAGAVTYQVSASEDDGYAFNPSAQNLQADYLRVGYSGFAQPPYYMSGMVFRNANIPPDSMILSAKLKVQSYNSNQTGTVYARLEAEAADNATGFSGSRRVDTLPTTTASVDWIIEEPWSANTWYESPDFAGVIQEVIDRPSWSAGNSLAILLSTSSEGGYRNFYSYDHDGDYAPILEIQY